MIFKFTVMSFVMFVVVTWFYSIVWASFVCMIFTLVGCIGGLIFDSFLTPIIFKQKEK